MLARDLIVQKDKGAHRNMQVRIGIQTLKCIFLKLDHTLLMPMAL